MYYHNNNEHHPPTRRLKSILKSFYHFTNNTLVYGSILTINYLFISMHINSIFAIY